VAGLAAAAAASLVLAFALRKRRAVHGTPDEEDKKLRRKERKARKDAAKASKKLSKKLGKANASSVDPGGGASPPPKSSSRATRVSACLAAPGVGRTSTRGRPRATTDAYTPSQEAPDTWSKSTQER